MLGDTDLKTWLSAFFSSSLPKLATE